MRFRPLHSDVGAEVLDFDIHAGGTPEEIAELRAAYDRYAMLLFRGQGRVAPLRQVEIAGWFGPPWPVDNTGNGDYVSVLANEDAAGSVVLPFHSDLTYTDTPIAAICLQAIALPKAGTSTTFVSGAAAWRRLPGELKRELEYCTARHVLARSATGMDWPEFVADHPVRFRHPRTGELILFVTQHHAVRILELKSGRSRDVLDAVFAHLYAEERRYVHAWELGDLLMWDNLVLQHARTEPSDPGQGARRLQRVALSEATLQETIDRARARDATYIPL